MKNVKNILLKVDFNGYGIVNYDSNDQKWVYKGDELNQRMGTRHNNVSYAKKDFFYNEDGDLDYKIKISHDCLMKNAFNRDFISRTTNVMHTSSTLLSYIASPVSLISGYLFADKQLTLKRKGAISLCDAIQTNNSVSKLEVFSKSGSKESNDGTTDKSDNSFFYKETIGDIEYSSKGNIDLMQLQFVSADQLFDRLAFDSDTYEMYKTFAKMRIPNFDSELGYYQLKNSIIEIPEYGIMLNSDNVQYLVKEALTRLLGLNIQKKDTFARVESLKIKLVYDPLVDTFDSGNNWIEIKNKSDIDNLSFSPEYFYEEVDMVIAKQLRADIEKVSKELKAKAAAEKTEKDVKSKKSKKGADVVTNSEIDE